MLSEREYTALGKGYSATLSCDSEDGAVRLHAELIDKLQYCVRYVDGCVCGWRAMRSGEKDVIIYPWYTGGVTRFDLPDVLAHLNVLQRQGGRSEGKQRAREIQAVLRG